MDKTHPPYYEPVVVERRIIADPLDFVRECRFSMGSALKYLWRAGKKPGEEERDDLQKALFFIDDCLQRAEVIPDFVARGKSEELGILAAENSWWRELLCREEPSQSRLIETQERLIERIAELNKGDKK